MQICSKHRDQNIIAGFDGPFCWDCADEKIDKANASSRQVGGEHYKTEGPQHWDMVHTFGLDYFQGNITKYLFRWRKKGGIQDLEKAKHYLEKYIEIARIEGVGPSNPKG